MKQLHSMHYELSCGKKCPISSAYSPTNTGFLALYNKSPDNARNSSVSKETGKGGIVS